MMCTTQHLNGLNQTITTLMTRSSAIVKLCTEKTITSDQCCFCEKLCAFPTGFNNRVVNSTECITIVATWEIKSCNSVLLLKSNLRDNGQCRSRCGEGKVKDSPLPTFSLPPVVVDLPSLLHVACTQPPRNFWPWPSGPATESFKTALPLPLGVPVYELNNCSNTVDTSLLVYKWSTGAIDYHRMPLTGLGKPRCTNSAVFFNIVQKGGRGGIKPMFKKIVANFV